MHDVHRHCYRISDIADYINWAYFFHAWGMPAKYSSLVGIHGCDACRKAWTETFPAEEQTQAQEAVRLFSDAQKMLSRINAYTQVHTLFKLFPANADGDDIVIHKEEGADVRLPMLRQQHPNKEGYCLCLSDFVLPIASRNSDRVGIFATSVASPTDYKDNYESLLAQTLCTRLAEAAAERLHQEVRKTLWGYAPDENLPVSDLHAEKFQGTRPAVGYPALPDLSLNFLIDELLGFTQIGIRLTEHGMMQPQASVSGLMFAHPQSCYFSVGKITEDQLADYAQRRGMPLAEIRTYLASSL